VNLGLQRLDDRILPAGNVTGTVLNGILTLTGDGEANSIVVRAGINSGVRIQGIGGTTINGGGIEDFSGAFKDVIILLGGADDTVNLEGGGLGTAARVSRDLVFHGGGGADTLTSEAGAVVGRDLTFVGGGGQTNTTLDDIMVGRNATFSGNEIVDIQSANGSRINGILAISTPTIAAVSLDGDELGRLSIAVDGQADVSLNSIWVGGNARVRGGVGDDLIDVDLGSEVLGRVVINVQDGNDDVDFDCDVGGDAFFFLGGGDTQDLSIQDSTIHGMLTIDSTGVAVDDWEIEGTSVFGRTTMSSGDGSDTILLNDGVFLGATSFFGGNGADQLHIGDGNDVGFRGKTLIDMGNGADTLQLGDGGLGEATFQYLVTLEGGNGINTLLDMNSEFNGESTVNGF
jgi:hypothetical protein